MPCAEVVSRLLRKVESRGGPFVDGVEIRLDRRNNPAIATIPNLIVENSRCA